MSVNPIPAGFHTIARPTSPLRTLMQRYLSTNEPPSFDEIIARLRVLETRINAMAKAP